MNYEINVEEEINRISRIISQDRIRKNEPMKLHTTMKAGGAARLFLTPGTEEELTELIRLLQEEKIPYYILGNGSNVICRDEGFAGAIVCMKDNYTGIDISEKTDRTQVRVKAGTLNKDLSDRLIAEGLAGFEFASGIPGSVGGGTVMNAGAYDGEFRQVIRKVRLMDRKGDIVEKSCEEMDFGYRHSLASSGDYIVLETTFEFRKDDPEAIQARVDDLTRRREEKQPLEYPSCGSTFKRPEGYFAGKLISDAGLKGFRLGGAQVSAKHAGFVINAEEASAAEILELIEYVRDKVLESQGVLLECEVKIL